MISTFFLLIIFSVSWSNNPFKISATLVVMSITMFLMMHEKGGTSMIVLVMLMMFSGGVTLVFMVVSSLYPNETMASKNLCVIFPLVMIVMLTELSIKSLVSSVEVGSWFLQGSMFIFTVFIVMFYFFSFIFSLKSEKSALRSNFCLWEAFL